MAKRFPERLGIWGDNGTRVIASEAMWAQPLKWAKKWRKAGRRGRVFCASLADWLEDRDELCEPRERLMDLIAETGDALEWLLLTKRPENGPQLLQARVDVPWDKFYSRSAIDCLKESGCRIGVSVESQEYTSRIAELRDWWDGPNFVSAEPLLGPLNFKGYIGHNAYNTVDASGRKFIRPVSWVVVGGESGPGYREMDLSAAQSIHDQCRAVGAAIFIKQDSGPRSGMRGRLSDELWAAKEFPQEAKP